jgi:hypothetical protein
MVNMEEKLIIMCFCVSVTCATAVFLKPVVKPSEDKQEEIKVKTSTQLIKESTWYKHIQTDEYEQR